MTSKRILQRSTILYGMGEVKNSLNSCEHDFIRSPELEKLDGVKEDLLFRCKKCLRVERISVDKNE